MINPLRIGAYTVWLAAEVVRGALVLAKDVFTPGVAMSPAIVELPLRCHTDLEISLMASSITITPGTVTIGVAAALGDTPPTLFVHAIYGEETEQVIGSLRDMEDRLLTMTRGQAPRQVGP